MHGSSEILCMASKQWSGNYACREVRCPKLAMPSNGGYKCSDGSYFNSRCQFFCSPGYTLRGDLSASCQSSRTWSGGNSMCVDVDPPVIKCPNIKEKTAEPGKLTAKVTWDTPEGKDTADGILTDVILKGKPSGSHFPEGNHKLSYTVSDRAENKATCRFNVRVRVRRCTPLSVPDNGCMKCDSAGDNYGATCEFRCLGGYELRGSAARVCQFNMEWSGLETSCAPMNINVGVRSAAALLDQFYEKRRILIISAPSAANHYYRFQMTNLQHAQCGLDLRHVTVIELVGVYPAQIGRISHRLIPPGLALQLRLLLQLSQNSFNMVLLDKQGVDKQRYTFPITAAEIFTTIDTFPLRTEEATLQKEARQSC
ncbi:sushi repeat-containing protein SRPX-like isoform X3 [Cyprinus carpio]|nr:sushi repeat-containing protein SRPX-like isoform X3 [Cyprinus carpio]